MQAGHDQALRNVSRDTSLGYLKRVCAPGEHMRYLDSPVCTRCGLRVELLDQKEEYGTITS